MMRETIRLNHSVPATLIPDGAPITLEKGEEVTLHQELGGSFTVVTQQGYLARIDGEYAEALGKEVKSAEKPTEVQSAEELEKLVWEELRTCYDPEIPVDIVELGLVYKCEVTPLENGNYRVTIAMTLTAPGCGMGPVLQYDVQRKIEKLPNVEEAHVEIVWYPPWTQDRMSEAAKLKLGLL
ncbi:MAG: putative Fe-S cluster assembly protein SufT [Deltaproteobacteria bacterium]|nr:MAG: putative Fe-S cluster assembly protein SufT [Deltaproteobacteria bacterium]